MLASAASQLDQQRIARRAYEIYESREDYLIMREDEVLAVIETV